MVEEDEEVSEEADEPIMDGLSTKKRRSPPKPKGTNIKGRRVNIQCVPCGGRRSWVVQSGTITDGICRGYSTVCPHLQI